MSNQNGVTPTNSTTTSTAPNAVIGGPFGTSANLAAYLTPVGYTTTGANPNAHGQGAADAPTAGSPILTQAQAQVSDEVADYGPSLKPASSTFDSLMSIAIPALTAAGLGAAVGPLIGAAVAGAGATGTAATIGTAAGTGAASGADQAALTGQNVGKGTLTGIISAVAPAALGAASSAISSVPAKLAVGAAAGAATGAATSALRGGNVGSGALSGAITGGVTAGAAALGAPGAVSSAAGKLAGSAVPASSAALPAATAAVGLGSTSLGASNGLNGTNTMADSSTIGSAQGAVQAGIGLGSTLLGTLGNAQNANAVGNVLSNAQAGTTVGTKTGYTGINGSATINNGQVSTSLNPTLTSANSNLGNLATQQAGIAGSINGQTPANVQNAINTQSTLNSQLPTSTNNLLAQQYGTQGAVQGSQLGLINSGTQALNNPLTGSLQSAAQTQLNTAGSDFTNTYNTQLAALNQSLALPTQQAESELADQQFGRGQLGTSGGALQTQAFATGLGQAYLGNQQTAYNEAMNAQNSATSNAATLSGAANTNLNTANSLLANAYGQFNNTSQLGTNTANSIFSQNSAISQLGNQYGQQNVNNQVTAATLPATLAGQYTANANNAVAGTGNLNTIANSQNTAALAAGTQQGSQYNGANQVSGQILNSQGFAINGQNGLSAIGAGINSALGSNGAAAGLVGGATNLASGVNYNGTMTPASGVTNVSDTDLNQIYSGNFSASPSVDQGSNYANYAQFLS